MLFGIVSAYLHLKAAKIVVHYVVQKSIYLTTN
jgi:hypothetical protein